MTVQHVILDTNTQGHAHGAAQPIGRTREGHAVIVITNGGNQSTIKGLLWGCCGLDFLGMTIGAAALTSYAVAAATFLSAIEPQVTPAAIAGASAIGVLTYGLAKATGGCFSNCFWHLGEARQQVVVTHS